jgi:acetoin utilization deacetylase AcuC-like enzyme
MTERVTLSSSVETFKEHDVTTRFYTHELSVEHLTPPGHPERPDRIRALNEAFSDPRFNALVRVDAPRAEEGWLELAHP